MMVVIANKQRDSIEASGLKNIEHKSAIGCYDAATFVKNLVKLEFDKLLIDVTAIRDAETKESWNVFKELVPASKVFILYDEKECDKSFLSNLVNCGFYNFGNSTDEILKLISTPNMFADVQKYIVTSEVKKVMPQTVNNQAIPKDKVPPKKIVDQKILDEFKDEYKVRYDVNNLIPSQLLCTILIYIILLAASSLELLKIVPKTVLKVLNLAPQSLRGILGFFIIFGFCLLASVPIIKFVKSKTNSVLRFLIVPSLLSLPLMYAIIELISSMNLSDEWALVFASTVVFYIPFVGTLLTNGIVKNFNSENMDIVKWNIFEKIGMVLCIYMFLIPLLQLFLECLNINFFDKINDILYFANSDSNIYSVIIFISCLIVPIFIMASRIISRRKGIK